MDMQPELYNETNKVQYERAYNLIHRINEENPNKEFDYVLDVGCGAGNITKLVNSRLNIKQLYAIDIDEAMIKFSKDNFPQSSTEYLVQDISVEWDQLRPEIRALEGKVSLIYTHYVIHWVKDKKNAATNLFRLLSNDGKIYGNFCYAQDLNFEPAEKEFYEQAIKIPTREQQMSSWELAFKNAGFKTVNIRFSVMEFLLDNEIFENATVSLEVMLCQTFFGEKDELNKTQLIARFADKISEKSPKFTDSTTDKPMVRYDSKIFIMKIAKNAY